MRGLRRLRMLTSSWSARTLRTACAKQKPQLGVRASRRASCCCSAIERSSRRGPPSRRCRHPRRHRRSHRLPSKCLRGRECSLHATTKSALFARWTKSQLSVVQRVHSESSLCACSFRSSFNDPPYGPRARQRSPETRADPWRRSLNWASCRELTLRRRQRVNSHLIVVRHGMT